MQIVIGRDVAGIGPIDTAPFETDLACLACLLATDDGAAVLRTDLAFAATLRVTGRVEKADPFLVILLQLELTVGILRVHRHRFRRHLFGAFRLTPFFAGMEQAEGMTELVSHHADDLGDLVFLGLGYVAASLLDHCARPGVRVVQQRLKVDHVALARRERPPLGVEDRTEANVDKLDISGVAERTHQREQLAEVQRLARIDDVDDPLGGVLVLAKDDRCRVARMVERATVAALQ